MSSALSWNLIEREGRPSALFDIGWFESAGAQRTIVHLHPTGPAVVLGSSQHESIVDVAAASRLGAEVVRRRSGGGAVWLDHALDWFDVVLPVGDPLAEADVQKAFHWLGEVFAETLRAVGVGADPGTEVRVHRGALARDPLNNVVCFAGLGPGEVTLGGRKIVGISQRRTRNYTLFQCGVLREWSPSPLVELLRPGLVAAGLTGTGSRASEQLASVLADRCVGVGVAGPRVVAGLIERLRCI